MEAGGAGRFSGRGGRAPAHLARFGQHRPAMPAALPQSGQKREPGQDRPDSGTEYNRDSSLFVARHWLA